MTKKSIIITSILCSILALLAILFGVVFRLRKIEVVITDKSEIVLTNDDIISASQLKLNKSIFMLDKQSVMDNIENKYAEIKVVDIKTTSVTSVKIMVRKRVEMFYAEYNSNYYCLDEDLKVLRITEIEPVNLIKISAEKLNINSDTKEKMFLNKDLAKLTYNFFVAMYENVKIDDDHYAERADICNLVNSLDFETDYALTDNGNNAVKFINLIVVTREGLKMQIASPEKDLGRKINICFATYNKLEDKTTGKIVIKYDGTVAYYPTV